MSARGVCVRCIGVVDATAGRTRPRQCQQLAFCMTEAKAVASGKHTMRGGCRTRSLDLPWWDKLLGMSFKGGKLHLKQLTGGMMDDITVSEGWGQGRVVRLRVVVARSAGPGGVRGGDRHPPASSSSLGGGADGQRRCGRRVGCAGPGSCPVSSCALARVQHITVCSSATGVAALGAACWA